MTLAKRGFALQHCCVIAGVTCGAGGCAAAQQSRSEPPAEVVAAKPERGSPAAAAEFSGLILYRLMKYTGDDDHDGTALGEMFYYVDGNHWKHVDKSGRVMVAYDPIANAVHYFGDQHEVVDAAQSDGLAAFEQLKETRRILGYDCRGLKMTAPDGETIMFYCPALRVDPARFPNHHVGHWTETLQATNGALNLWSDMRRAEWRLVSEAVRIEHIRFDDEFWDLPADDG